MKILILGKKLFINRCFYYYHYYYQYNNNNNYYYYRCCCFIFFIYFFKVHRILISMYSSFSQM